ncbi:hypothetical protein HDU97_001289 [Phlyctochytrium planicorne]|nr:hypothetical protein HDU97_001289 [Phlyctochytrium planicorne]
MNGSESGGDPTAPHLQLPQEPSNSSGNSSPRQGGVPKANVSGSRAKILADQRRQQRHEAASKILPAISRSTSESEVSPLLSVQNGAQSPTRGGIDYGSIPHHRLPDHLFNQEIIIDDELRVNLTGHRLSIFRILLYRFLCVITLGVFYLVCRWLPMLELTMTSVRCPMNVAEVVSVKNQWGEVSVEKVHRDPFEGGFVADIFPNHPEPGQNGLLSTRQSEDAAAAASQPLPIIIYFDYRYIKFIFNPNTGLFETTQYWQDPEWTGVDRVLNGLTSSLLLSRRKLIFGSNEVIIKEKPTLKLLVDEVLHPFFIFQILSMILWSLDEYYYYAACIFFITVTSTASTLYETKDTMRRLGEMSKFTCKVRVWRSGVWLVLDSEDLVPGDIFEITPGGYLPILPCDAILVDGDCIVNESMLTGESVPVSKTAITDAELQEIDFEEEDPANSNRMSRFFLFSGTKVIRARCGTKLTGVNAPDPDAGLHFSSQVLEPGALALVVRVGFNTTKGALVRSILFPKPNTFKFYRDSFRFIGVLGMVAFFGFLASLYNFIKLGNDWTTIVVRALDLITIVVPPALPATMAVGTSFAIGRLRRGLIFCTSPPRVNICGKLEAMCFDKTGTLTLEGLDVLGFRFTVPSAPPSNPAFNLSNPVSKKISADSISPQPSPPIHSSRGNLRFSDLYRDIEDVVIPPETAVTSPTDYFSHDRRQSHASVRLAAYPFHPNGAETDFPYPMIVCAMAVCHSIKVVDGNLIGDPMDIKMFEFTGWDLEEGGHSFSSMESQSRKSLDGVPVEPASKSRGTGAGGLISMVVRPPGDLGFKEVISTGESSSANSSSAAGYAPYHSPSMMVANPANSKIYTELGVVRAFEFVSSLRRMSVVVRRLRYSKDSLNFGNTSNESSVNGKLPGSLVSPSPLSPPSASIYGSSPNGINSILGSLGTVTVNNGMKEFEVFVKGAPEVLKTICNPESLPENYDALLKSYAHHGYRVIACGWRKLENVAWTKVMRMKREDIERNLEFLGFIVFENKLKPGTAPIVNELKAASMRQIMCTGDNILTAISVSRECGLVDSDSKIFVPRFATQAFVHDEESKVVWEDVDHEESTSENVVATLDSVSLKPVNVQSPAISTRSGVLIPVDFKYDLAVTGEIFQWMLEYASLDSFQRMLVKGQIFARMSPEQKQILVERLQDLGYCVGFCGDGANDCGALKAADVGLSLSEAEASVAAPFTSRSTEIDCVTRIIREGRAALVTSFACFKFMAVYSLIQFTSVSLLYVLGSNLADLQFMFVDMALIVPVAVFMSESGAYSKISSKRPTASLVSKKVLSSMLGQVVIQAAFQVMIFFWVKTTPWYIPTKTDVGRKTFKCHENTVVFLLSCFQYTSVAMVFCSGPPFRESVWKNTKFVLTVFVLMVFLIYCTLAPHPYIAWAFDLMVVPYSGRLEILGFAFANIVLNFAGEYFIFPVVSKLIGSITIFTSILFHRRQCEAESKSIGKSSRAWVKRRRWNKKGKLFKIVADDLNS